MKAGISAITLAAALPFASAAFADCDAASGEYTYICTGTVADAQTLQADDAMYVDSDTTVGSASDTYGIHFTGASLLYNKGTITGGYALWIAADATVINYGTIQGVNGGTAVFQQNPNAALDLTNYGTITGTIYMSGTGENSIVNYGTITGDITLGMGVDTLTLADGVVDGGIDMGSGDDTVILSGGTTTGTIDFGAGDDTLEVASSGAGAYSLANFSNLETIEGYEGYDAFLQTDDYLVVANKAAFSGMDELSTRLAFNITSDALAQKLSTGWWGSASAVTRDGTQSDLVVGYDASEALGVYLASQGQKSDTDGSLGLRSHTVVAGLRAGYDLGGAALRGTAYVGRSRTDVVGSAAMDVEGIDGTVYGVAGRADMTPAFARGAIFTAHAGVSGAHYDGFTVAGLDGTNFGSRDSLSGYVGMQASLPVKVGTAGKITPFVGYDLLSADGDDVSMSLDGSSTTFGAGDDSSTSIYTVGFDLTPAGKAPWSARVAMRFGEDDDDSAVAGFSMHF